MKRSHSERLTMTALSGSPIKPPALPEGLTCTMQCCSATSLFQSNSCLPHPNPYPLIAQRGWRCRDLQTAQRMIGRVGERRRTCENPAFSKVETNPV